MRVKVYINSIKFNRSLVDGPGVRTVVFFQGCDLRCKGCQNPESWDFCAGKLFNEEAKQELFEALDKPYIQGITFSGGHPIERKNACTIFGLIEEIKKKFPSKDIWLYTGLKLSMDDFAPMYLDKVIPNEIFKMCDVVVDGPYIEEQRDITLSFRGSKNQRLIDVKETIKQGQIIQYKIN